MIDTYLLEQLTAVHECGTLSAASEKLHLTQPTLTRSMQKLEDIFGVKLFERTKNRVHLNENGRLAAECARSGAGSLFPDAGGGDDLAGADAGAESAARVPLPGHDHRHRAAHGGGAA